MKIFITGIGVISAIGNDVNENLNSLRSGLTGIKRSDRLGLMLGEVKLRNEAIRNKFSLPVEDFSRTSLLAIVAAKEAWGDNRHHEKVRTGLISATSAGGLDRMEEYYFHSQKTGSDETYHLMTHDNGRTTESTARHLGISGYIGTISTACSSGANAIMHGGRLIRGGMFDRMVVGGADPLATYNIKGFSSLNIYDQVLCRPFDESRKGLNLGEGAGFLVLENAHSLSITGNTPLCLLSGWDNSTDAFHQTASSAEGKGAALSMKRALVKAGLPTSKISYINAHGTGTANNDLSESMAIKTVFGEAIPPFSSTKGFTGHTLAAAGSIEAVYCVLSITSDAILPNLNFSTAIKETGMVPETGFREEAGVEHVLSNSFGFGGNCTSLIFSKLS